MMKKKKEQKQEKMAQTKVIDKYHEDLKPKIYCDSPLSSRKKNKNLNIKRDFFK